MTEEKPKEKDKGELIRGRDLKITESDVFGSLPFFMRVYAWLFGGVFGMRAGVDPISKVPRIIIVYVPSIWSRVRYKRLNKQIIVGDIK